MKLSNPLDIPEPILKRRLARLDSLGKISVHVSPLADGERYIIAETTLTAEQVQVLLTSPATPAEEASTARQSAAWDIAYAIPDGWRTWTHADWTAYYNANISATEIAKIGSLADAKAILTKMSTVLDRIAKMVIALRDHTFPDLPE